MRFKRKSKKKNDDDLIGEAEFMKTADDQMVTEFPSTVINQLRHMVTRLKYTDDLPTTISLVSAVRGEGVTYTSWALASIIANDLQAKVCAVELNWWFPTEQTFIDEDYGIASVLTGEKSLDDVICKTQNDCFDFILAGSMETQHRATFARSEKLKELIKELQDRYDYVLIDAPATLSTSDAIPLASLSTSCCLVVRQGVTHIDHVKMALDDVAHLKILGVILNQVTLKTPSFILRMIPQN